MGAMLLASKVEENPKEIRDVMIFLMIVYCYYLTAYQVILVFHRIYQRRNDYQIKNLDISGEQYNKWKSG